MKPNFICPKCKSEIVVGKKLHGSYTCCHCHYTMILTKEDVMRGTKPYRGWFKTDEKRPYDNNRNTAKTYNKPNFRHFKSNNFKKSQENA